MKLTRNGQLTIPPAMRKKHGLSPEGEIELVDQPNGVLIVKAGKFPHGKRALAAMMRGGKVKGSTKAWLRLTRAA